MPMSLCLTQPAVLPQAWRVQGFFSGLRWLLKAVLKPHTPHFPLTLWVIIA